MAAKQNIYCYNITKLYLCGKLLAKKHTLLTALSEILEKRIFTTL